MSLNYSISFTRTKNLDLIQNLGSESSWARTKTAHTKFDWADADPAAEKS